MQNRMFYNWVRVNKAVARREYNNGEDILLNPVKMPVKRDFFCCHSIIDNKKKHDFDKLVNQFEYYNCSNETGKYTAFYIYKPL